MTDFLIIARHAGESGSGGSRRPVLIARTLQAMGHGVRLVTPFPVEGVEAVMRVPLAGVPMNNVGGELAIQRRPRPATGLRSLPRRLLPAPVMEPARRWAAFPDPERSWAHAVLSEIEATRPRADWIITTSPPESLHAIGRHAADICGARWAAELRDSWVEDPHRDYVRGPRAVAERAAAKRWLGRADALLTVNDSIATEAGSLSSAPALVLPHYSEPQKSDDITAFGSDAFDLLHSGAMELSDRRRDFRDMLERLDPLCAARTVRGLAPIRLHVTGRLSEREAALARAREIQDANRVQVVAHGPVPLAESRALQRRADGLLLYVPDGSRALPGKYAEYALTGRPVFLLGPDRIRAMTASPYLMEPADRLATAELGGRGPIDSSYSVDQSVERLVDWLSELG